MVRALLDGSKTQTRRVVKPVPVLTEGWWEHLIDNKSRMLSSKWLNDGHPPLLMRKHCPYGVPGDHLWVRETHFVCASRRKTFYRATDPDARIFSPGFLGHGVNAPLVSWTPSIFMRRDVCRLMLEVTDVRVERLNNISDEDCLAEGVTPDALMRTQEQIYGAGWDTPKRAYQDIWESINGGASWTANPWVWVVSFVKIPVLFI